MRHTIHGLLLFNISRRHGLYSPWWFPMYSSFLFLSFPICWSRFPLVIILAKRQILFKPPLHNLKAYIKHNANKTDCSNIGAGQQRHCRSPRTGPMVGRAWWSWTRQAGRIERHWRTISHHCIYIPPRIPHRPRLQCNGECDPFRQILRVLGLDQHSFWAAGKQMP